MPESHTLVDSKGSTDMERVYLIIFKCFVTNPDTSKEILSQDQELPPFKASGNILLWASMRRNVNENPLWAGLLPGLAAL